MSNCLPWQGRPWALGEPIQHADHLVRDYWSTNSSSASLVVDRACRGVLFFLTDAMPPSIAEAEKYSSLWPTDLTVGCW